MSTQTVNGFHTVETITDANLIPTCDSLMALTIDAGRANLAVTGKLMQQFEDGRLTVGEMMGALYDVIVAAEAADLRSRLLAGTRTPIFAARLAAALAAQS